MSAEDPLFREVRTAERLRERLWTCGVQIELWEALRLLHVGGDVLAEQPDGDDGPSPSLRHAVRTGRATWGPLCRRLRGLLKSLPFPMDGTRLDMLVALILCSPQWREAAESWLTLTRTPVEDIRPLLTVVDRCRRELVKWRSRRMPRPPAAAPKKQPPAGINTELLEDVREALALRRAARALELWEAVVLASQDRGAVRAARAELDRQHAGAPGTDLNEQLILFLEWALSVRSDLRPLARQLRSLAASLPLGSYGKETQELALAFVLASAEGRRHARAWVEDPGRFRLEAAIRFEGVIGKAVNYERALRPLSA